eukprot:4326330-Amphidinium_carterae.2
MSAWMTGKWRQRPVWSTDWESTSSGLYIVRSSSLYTCPQSILPTERVCRLLALQRAQHTKEQSLNWRSELSQTTKVTNRYFPGLGKASMPQTAHPRLQFLGWGWFKISWLKAPGTPAGNLHQPGTAGIALFRHLVFHRLVTADQQQQCHGVFHWIMSCDSLQPFEHRPCDAQPC